MAPTPLHLFFFCQSDFLNSFRYLKKKKSYRLLQQRPAGGHRACLMISGFAVTQRMALKIYLFIFKITAHSYFLIPSYRITAAFYSLLLHNSAHSLAPRQKRSMLKYSDDITAVRCHLDSPRRARVRVEQREREKRRAGRRKEAECGSSIRC